MLFLARWLGLIAWGAIFLWVASLAGDGISLLTGMPRLLTLIIAIVISALPFLNLIFAGYLLVEVYQWSIWSAGMLLVGLAVVQWAARLVSGWARVVSASSETTPDT